MKSLLLSLCIILFSITPAHSQPASPAEPDTTQATAQIESAVGKVEPIDSDSESQNGGGTDQELRELTKELVGELNSEWHKLDADEKAQLRESLKSIGDGVSIELDTDTSAGEVLIAITAILFTLGSPILIVAIVLFYAHRKRKQRDELITRFVDAGKDVPPQILESYDRATSPANNLHRGIMLCGIGIGLALVLGILADWEFAAIGIIPLFIGLARLLIWRLDNKQVESVAP